MPRDPAPDLSTDVCDREADEDLFCARCGRLVTKGRWRIGMNGDHEHVVFNPAGVIFRILCFKEAPGAMAVAAATAEFTWFKGWAWRIAVCLGYGSHLGWRYEGAAEPRVFFGLIAAAVRPTRLPD